MLCLKISGYNRTKSPKAWNNWAFSTWTAHFSKNKRCRKLWNFVMGLGTLTQKSIMLYSCRFATSDVSPSVPSMQCDRNHIGHLARARVELIGMKVRCQLGLSTLLLWYASEAAANIGSKPNQGQLEHVLSRELSASGCNLKLLTLLLNVLVSEEERVLQMCGLFYLFCSSSLLWWKEKTAYCQNNTSLICLWKGDHRWMTCILWMLKKHKNVSVFQMCVTRL